MMINQSVNQSIHQSFILLVRDSDIFINEGRKVSWGGKQSVEKVVCVCQIGSEGGLQLVSMSEEVKADLQTLK